MIERIKSIWKEQCRKSELRIIRKHFSSTDTPLDDYTDSDIAQMIKLGSLMKEHKISADFVIKNVLPGMEVYCHECSKAGGADMPIYHLPILHQRVNKK